MTRSLKRWGLKHTVAIKKEFQKVWLEYFIPQDKNTIPQQCSVKKGESLGEEVKIINPKSKGRDREQARKDYTNPQTSQD